jgi:putative addiction module component (TIGR02574 family)
MTVQTKALLDAALALPETERALLADELWESLSPSDEVMTDDQLYAELERRDAELEKDPSAAIPWAELEKEE